MDKTNLNSKHYTNQEANSLFKKALQNFEDEMPKLRTSYSDLLRVIDNAPTETEREAARFMQDMIVDRAGMLTYTLQMFLLDAQEAAFARLLEVDRLLSSANEDQRDELLSEKGEILSSFVKEQEKRDKATITTEEDALFYGTMRERHRYFYNEELVLPDEAAPYLLFV